jgi:hypothetical protein
VTSANKARHLIDIGRKSALRPASLLAPHKEPEPLTDYELSTPADVVAAMTQLVR